MKKPKTTSLSLFEKLENFFSKNQYIVISLSILASVGFSFLYFDPDVSVGGDDSGYIFSAHNFLNGTAFPTWHGSFYSIILSLFMWIGGANIIFLKMVSILFNAASIFFIYKLFIKLSNHTITAIVVILTSINFLLNKYASTTYSEPFFILFQSVYLYLFISFLTKDKNKRSSWLIMILLGVMSYLLMQTRTIAISLLAVTIITLLFEKQFLNSIIYTGSTFAFHIIYSLYKKIIWSYNQTGFESQLESLLQKNAYSAADGKEDVWGLVQRIWDNSELYLSKHLMKMTGFVSIESMKSSTYLTIGIYLVLFLTAFIALKKTKKVIPILLFLVGYIGISFISLQKMWDQERIIMVYFPYITLIVFIAIFKIFENEKVRKLQVLPIIFAFILFASILKQAIQQKDNFKFEHKFKSGYFQSYNIDWRNYMLACRWASENLPDSSNVICRKPNMAWIAGGEKDFFKGLYKIESYDADSITSFYHDSRITHIIMANLRVDPRRKTDKTINTVRNSLLVYTSKNPGNLKLLKEFGYDEKAYVFELSYNDELSEEERIYNFESDIIINPLNKYPYGVIANYYFAQKDYEKALTYFQKPLEYYKDDSKIYFNVAVSQMFLEDHKSAETNLLKTLELDPNSFGAQYNLTLTYIRLGEKQKAQESLNRLLRIDNNQDIRYLQYQIQNM